MRTSFLSSFMRLAPVAGLAALFLLFCVLVFDPAKICEEKTRGGLLLLGGFVLLTLGSAVLLIRSQIRRLRRQARKLRDHRENLKKGIVKAKIELRSRRRRAEFDARAKTQFLAAVSHDLRQPLHALQLFADNLARIADTSEERFLVRRIREAAAAMGEHLGRLLLLSRLSLSEMPPKEELVSLRLVFQQLRMIYLPIAEQKNIRLIVADSRAWFLTDAVLLERLIGNLIDNALKFSPPGGAVLVCARRAHLARDSAHPALRIEVRDNGPGIPREQQHLIYNEFVQLGNPERSAEAGLGLGLSIVRSIAGMLHAKPDLRSQPGRGSVFAFTLPLAETPAGEETGGGKLPPRLILIGVSDDFADRAVRWGYSICRAPDIAGAWRLFEEGDGIPVIAHDHGGPLPDEIGVLLKQHRGIVVTPARERIEPLGPYHLCEPIRPAALRALLRSLHPAADEAD
ncbi:MAG: HAMP domain-containing histidine kinase [Betaproteobacteria bacterium]|nr:HAMP domain-containing histidine kinase [Betaproteobacteria bacterium]